MLARGVVGNSPAIWPHVSITNNTLHRKYLASYHFRLINCITFQALYPPSVFRILTWSNARAGSGPLVTKSLIIMFLETRHVASGPSVGASSWRIVDSSCSSDIRTTTMYKIHHHMLMLQLDKYPCVACAECGTYYVLKSACQINPIDPNPGKKKRQEIVMLPAL